MSQTPVTFTSECPPDDLVGKAFLAPGDQAVIPAPSYAMYRIISEQRGARVIGVPRRPAGDGWAMDLGADRLIAAAREIGAVR